MIAFQVRRKSSTLIATIGDLWYSVDGGEWNRLCYTLEDVVREIPGVPVASWKIDGKTAIPVGKYDLFVNRSNRFSAKAGHDVFLPLLIDVPGFAGVRIHGGNDADDTEGCILVAYNHPFADTIQGTAISGVLAKLAAHGNKATIEVINA